MFNVGLFHVGPVDWAATLGVGPKVTLPSKTKKKKKQSNRKEQKKKKKTKKKG